MSESYWDNVNVTCPFLSMNQTKKLFVKVSWTVAITGFVSPELKTKKASKKSTAARITKTVQ